MPDSKSLGIGKRGDEDFSFVHSSPSEIVILPYEIVMSIGRGSLRSIGVYEDDPEEALEELMSFLGL